MRKLASYLVTLLVVNLFTIVAYAQNNVTVNGNVKNSKSKENVAAVSVTVKGGDAGTFTDDKGNFSIEVKSLPVTLVFSSIGFDAQEITVTEKKNVDVAFNPASTLGQEIVVSASRVAERILESPVSIERVSAAAIRNAPSANFYDIVSTLKGVDVTTSSITFRTPTTRGFGGSGNVRFNQLVDGMDNQAPGLNFSVGAIIGLNELDIDNIELLSGASSALYGSGGMNGTMLMTSKNPFKYQGFSFMVKEGMMHADGKERGASSYHNWSMRWATKINNRLAFKATGEFVQAKDWIGIDYRDYDRSRAKLKAGTRETDPNYDGVNVYGDETSVDLSPILKGIGQQAPFLAQFINGLTANPMFVSRTGYTEKELINPNAVNFKVSGSLHYKISNKTEAILAAYWGTGSSVYTGASRYSLRNFKMGQYKLEFNNKNWVLRAYTSQENAGDTYNLAATTQNFNEAWKPSITLDANGNPTPQTTDWYIQYAQTFLNSKLNGMSDVAAHNAARSVADVGRPVVGTKEFKDLYEKIRRLPVPQGGALLDRSDLYAIDGNYNLSEFTSAVADVIIGANYKTYRMNSQGTLFADSLKPIGIKEYGVFIQASREITSSLKVTASGRYDKNEYFKGRFTPRVTAVYTVAKNNNIRLSYQTAYRFPSNQMQWINLDLNSYKLIGGNKNFAQLYHFDTNPIYDRDSLVNGKTISQSFGSFKPESLSSFELGYKGLLMNGKLLVDIYGYYGQYTDFLARRVVVQSKTGAPIVQADADTGNIFSIPVNITEKLKTYGFGIGLDYRLPANFTISVNAASDRLDHVPSSFIANYNTPKWKLNASLSNSGFGKGKRFGFNIAYRYQEAFYFEGDLANGNIQPVTTLDAQVSMKMPKIKTMIKIGATNLLNEYYYNAVGNSYVGGLYYIGLGYNIF
ncbi:MAG: TonB-dependent receptor [Bacteroidetes bacterium]|nr:TonB-dependent receptor [Bacteroidota bacterium]